MKKLIFATGNKNKMREIREITAGMDIEVVSMREAGCEVDADETGSTFAENSLIKARAVMEALKSAGTVGCEDVDSTSGCDNVGGIGSADGMSRQYDEIIVVADDSGLEIDALGGEPGIYSARYLGHDTSYDIKNTDLLRRMEGVPDEERTARFVCAVAAVFSDGREETFVRTMEGRIGYEIAGENGFGYDPIFYLPGFGKTSAEISPNEKNSISHRGKAMREMARFLRWGDAAVMSDGVKRYKCPCCGYYTFGRYPDGKFDICPVCLWEDETGYTDDDVYSEANRKTLGEARRSYDRCGACEERLVDRTREPMSVERLQ